MKTCSQCGRQSADAARWCIACRTPFDAVATAAAPVPASTAASGACPVCHGLAGPGQLLARRIGESKTWGIPLIAGVKVTEFEQGRFHGVCGACMQRLFWKQLAAWCLAWTPVAVVVIIAAVSKSELVAAGAGVAAIFMLTRIFHTWADGLVWGESLVASLGLPPGFYVPVGIGQVLARGLGLPAALCFLATAVLGVFSAVTR